MSVSSQMQLHAMGMEAEKDDWKSQNSDSGEEINTVKIRALKAYSATLEVLINRKVISMQYDPGAAKSVISNTSMDINRITAFETYWILGSVYQCGC